VLRQLGVSTSYAIGGTDAGTEVGVDGGDGGDAAAVPSPEQQPGGGTLWADSPTSNTLHSKP